MSSPSRIPLPIDDLALHLPIQSLQGNTNCIHMEMDQNQHSNSQLHEYTNSQSGEDTNSQPQDDQNTTLPSEDENLASPQCPRTPLIFEASQENQILEGFNQNRILENSQSQPQEEEGQNVAHDFIHPSQPQVAPLSEFPSSRVYLSFIFEKQDQICPSPVYSKHIYSSDQEEQEWESRHDKSCPTSSKYSPLRKRKRVEEFDGPNVVPPLSQQDEEDSRPSPPKKFKSYP